MTSANHFDVLGHGIAGVVDLAGITGQPVVSLRVDGNAIDDATVESTAFGHEVTALVDAAPDLQSRSLRLTLPAVNLDGDTAVFSAVALIVTGRTSIGGPGLVRGALHEYDVRPIAGTASSVQS